MGKRFRVMEKKLTNSGPFMASTSKHSIYPLQVVGIRNAKAERRRADIWCKVQPPRVWVLTVEAAGGLQHHRRVRDSEGKDRHTVKRLTGRHHAARAEQAATRFEAHNIIQPG